MFVGIHQLHTLFRLDLDGGHFGVKDSGFFGLLPQMLTSQGKSVAFLDDDCKREPESSAAILKDCESRKSKNSVKRNQMFHIFL
jgi:hypothetical protein